jgi:hypothetical protein
LEKELVKFYGFTAACTLQAVLLLAAAHCYSSGHRPANTPFQVHNNLQKKNSDNIKTTAERNFSNRDQSKKQQR